MKHLHAREGRTIYCESCLQRWFIIFEPDFAKGEEDQVKPQVPVCCPFCGDHQLEPEGEVIKDARAVSEETIRSWRGW